MVFLFFMIRRPPRSTRTDTLFPYTTLFRSFYNGHSRIALRMLEADPDVAVDAAWFAHRIGEAVRLRREVLDLDAVSDAWRVVHSEGDGLSRSEERRVGKECVRTCSSRWTAVH